MKHWINLTIAAVVLLASSSAWAGVCVQVDQERDNLPASDRAAVKTMVEDSLRRAGQDVTEDSCTTTYTIYSLRLGNSVVANIRGPQGTKTQKAHNIEELSETYDQLVKGLLNGDKGQMAGVDRHNVTKKQAAPRRVHADSIYYLRLGYGTVLGGDFASGPAFGFGWRYELDRMGIDISGLNFVYNDTADTGAGATFTLLRLGGVYFFNPDANSSAYADAALSWGFSGVSKKINGDTIGYEDSGLQGEIGAGYEFLRASTIRMFVEANAVLPFYTADPISANASSVYTPSFTISLGLGYDSSPSQTVEVYDD